MTQERTWLWWSSGKDAAWSLTTLREQGQAVEGLITTLDPRSERVGLHGTPRELVQRQAAALGLPLVTMALPWPSPNDVYERAFAAVCNRALEQGVTAMAFGDLHLEEIRRYRCGLLRGTGIEPRFPLWGADTGGLARRMLAGAMDALVTCVDTRALPAELAGRRWDAAFLDALPAAVDPCGENGEFHTFVRRAPGFANAVDVELDDPVEHEGFVVAAPRPVSESRTPATR